MTDWAKEAKGILRGEMTKRGVTFKGLSERLAEEGVTDSDVNLRNKVSRGTFTAAFFLQCLAVLGVKTVRLDD